MYGLKWSRTVAIAIACVIFLVPLGIASGQPVTTRVEHESKWWPEGQGGILGTIHYRPSQEEQSFYRRLPNDEVITGSHKDDYDVATKEKKYIGWFGIVREIDEIAAANRTLLTIEHKYFDGLTDAHLQAVSFNGSGDFQANLTGIGHRIPPLSLVKVYGTSTQGKPGAPPLINAEFVRNWHWGTFTFLAAYGTQRGNQEWRKANQIPLDEIYEAWPHPCHHYYELRLGTRPDAPQIHKRLLDAAGALAPEARGAMERLADLLALGHTWSQAETMRQSRELSQIGTIIKTTGAHNAAISLLLQALLENDERVSWSASEKFATFDLAGDAIGPLVKLLDHENPRVRAGAARGLLEYGAKAAPAVAALSRCVARTDLDLKRYAILALGEIGPGAKAAQPALKSATSDSDRETRINSAKALWRITREPEGVIAVFASALESDDEQERYDAAEQLKEMGPWAAPAVGALIKALKSGEWTTRSNMAEALGEIGEAAAPAIPALAAALANDEDAIVQSNAAEALGKIRNPQAIAFLIGALQSDDDHVRFNSIQALEAFGHAAKAAIPTLIRAVTSDAANDWIAASALGAIDAEGASTPTLIEALGNGNSQLRRFAAHGLGKIGPRAEAAEKALLDQLQDSDPGARIAAAAAYWSVSGKSDAPVRILRSAIEEPGDWTAQMWAADALAEIGSAANAAIPELIACLKRDRRYVVTSAAKALGKIGSDAERAVPALTAQLDGADDLYTRVCIARALWRIDHSERSLPVLQDALANSGDFMALSEAAEAIGEMGPSSVASAPLLRPLLMDSSSFVREAAAKALNQIEQR